MYLSHASPERSGTLRCKPKYITFDPFDKIFISLKYTTFSFSTPYTARHDRAWVPNLSDLVIWNNVGFEHGLKDARLSLRLCLSLSGRLRHGRRDRLVPSYVAAPTGCRCCFRSLCFLLAVVQISDDREIFVRHHSIRVIACGAHSSGNSLVGLPPNPNHFSIDKTGGCAPVLCSSCKRMLSV